MRIHPPIAFASLLFGSQSVMSAVSGAAMQDTEATQAVGILDAPEIASLGWVSDFRYIPQTTTAQREKVVTYTMRMIEDHVQSLLQRKLHWVMPTASSDEHFILVYSYGWPGEPKIDPLPLFGYQITDPATTRHKLKIILTGGNHAREAPSNLAFHGLIEFLVSDDSRAQTLREKIISYVYPSINPNGRQYILSKAHANLMPSSGNPQLKASGGESNYNRVWETEGKFIDIDAFKVAWRKDSGGHVDYFFDFHGIPQTTSLFSCEKSANTPLGQALFGRGFNSRFSGKTPAPRDGMTLRRWSMSEDGLTQVTFTPEIANDSLPWLRLEGQKFALAMHDMITGEKHPFPHIAKTELEPRKPSVPLSAWLFDGNTHSAVNNGRPGESHTVEWLADTPFTYPENQSLRLGKDNSFVDFGNDKGLDYRQSLTVSLWVKGDSRNAEGRFLFSRYDGEENQRAWALIQLSHLLETLTYISADGPHEGSKISAISPPSAPCSMSSTAAGGISPSPLRAEAKGACLKFMWMAESFNVQAACMSFPTGLSPNCLTPPLRSASAPPKKTKIHFRVKSTKLASSPLRFLPRKFAGCPRTVFTIS